MYMFKNLIYKLDFYFILAIIAIFSLAAALHIQLKEASSELGLLSSSMAPLVRNSRDAANINETLRLNQELDDLEYQLEILDLNQ